MAIFIILKIIPVVVFYYFHTKQRGLPLYTILLVYLNLE